MVFANLSNQEKDSFFQLLDEYFESRPELKAKLQQSEGTAGPVAAPPKRVNMPSHNTNPPAPKGLVTAQKWGNIDTSSKGSAFASTFKKAPAPSAPPVAPPAFPRVVAKPEEPRGEWADVLYDYDSSEPGDLPIRENQRVLVTERTSADWWTGEVDGRSGLFPASYVKIA